MTHDLTALLAELDGLEAKAVPGPWVIATVAATATGAPQPYALWTNEGPRTVTVGKSTLPHADDAVFMFSLRNAYPLLRRSLAESRATLEALEGKMGALQAAAPLCEQHKPKGGTRGGCLVCALEKLSSALSQIDYICGPENDMQVSGYDVHCDEEAVVKRVIDVIRRPLTAAEEVRAGTVEEIVQELASLYSGFQDLPPEKREAWAEGVSASIDVVRALPAAHSGRKG